MREATRKGIFKFNQMHAALEKVKLWKQCQDFWMPEVQRGTCKGGAPNNDWTMISLFMDILEVD